MSNTGTYVENIRRKWILTLNEFKYSSVKELTTFFDLTKMPCIHSKTHAYVAYKIFFGFFIKENKNAINKNKRLWLFLICLIFNRFFFLYYLIFISLPFFLSFFEIFLLSFVSFPLHYYFLHNLFSIIKIRKKKKQTIFCFVKCFIWLVYLISYLFL